MIYNKNLNKNFNKNFNYNYNKIILFSSKFNKIKYKLIIQL